MARSIATKTIAEKNSVRPNMSLWLSGPDRISLISPLPHGVTSATRIDEATAALIFANDAASLRTMLDAHRDGLTKPALFWVAYPKANRTGLNRYSLWPILTEFEMRPNGQVAIDEIWSALRFRPNAEGEARFTGGKS